MFLTNHSLLFSLILATSRPSNAAKLYANSPFIVLIVSEVFLPNIPRSFASWSNTNVPWLQLSRSSLVRTALQVSFDLIYTKTMHILTTSDQKLVDPHVTSSGLSPLVSVSSFFPYFLYF